MADYTRIKFSCSTAAIQTDMTREGYSPSGLLFSYHVNPSGLLFAIQVPYDTVYHC